MEFAFFLHTAILKFSRNVFDGIGNLHEKETQSQRNFCFSSKKKSYKPFVEVMFDMLLNHTRENCFGAFFAQFRVIACLRII